VAVDLPITDYIIILTALVLSNFADASALVGYDTAHIDKKRITALFSYQLSSDLLFSNEKKAWS
jgi:hypothetical protein